MMTLDQILSSQSDLLNGKRVKLVRHKDTREEYREAIKNRPALLEYQREQGKHIFSRCDYIVSFFGLEHSRSVFFGVFKVNGHKIVNGKYYYDLEEVKAYRSLVDRLVIDWGSNARAWHQWYHRCPKEVLEVLPEGTIGDFKGLQNFVLEYRDLQRLVQHKNANREWMHHLSSIKGIYLILDTKAGQQYVGSAYGDRGIWQRWEAYAKNPSGGNKLLKKLMLKDSQYHRHFRFSVLQTLPSNAHKQDALAAERFYKEKLGSRAHGLNAN